MTSPGGNAPAVGPAMQGAHAVFARLGCAIPGTLRDDTASHGAATPPGNIAKSEANRGDSSIDIPVPDGLANLHPSWLRYVLGRERPEVAAALAVRLEAAGVGCGEGAWRTARPAPLLPSVASDLLWLLFGRLSDPNPAQQAFPADRSLDDAMGSTRAVLWHRLPGTVLWRALCERGAAEVGRSLHRAEPVMRARAMATVGAPWAQVIARFAAENVEPPARDRARLAVARAGAMAGRDDVPLEDAGRPGAEVRLAFVGLSAARPELSAAGPAALRTIALRLPAVVGRFLLEGGPA